MSLEQDFIAVPGQLFACLSIVGPDCPQKTDKFGIKIRGCFATRDEASNYAKRLQAGDSTFDIYVVDMYKWLLIPPDNKQIDDVHYGEEKLEEIMQKYKENQTMAAKMFEDRKRDSMAKPLPQAGDTPFIKSGDDNSKFYSKPDEAPLSHPAEIVDKLKAEHPDMSMEDLVKKADDICAEEVRVRQERRDAEDKKENENESEEKSETSDPDLALEV